MIRKYLPSVFFMAVLLGFIPSASVAQVPTAPTLPAAGTSSSSPNPFLVYGVVTVCTPPTVVFGVPVPGTGSTTSQCQVINFDLSSVVACFSDQNKPLAISYIQWLLVGQYNSVVQNLCPAGATSSCQVYFSFPPPGALSPVSYPPNYAAFAQYVNDVDPGFDPSLLFSAGELICAQAMIDNMLQSAANK